MTHTSIGDSARSRGVRRAPAALVLAALVLAAAPTGAGAGVDAALRGLVLVAGRPAAHAVVWLEASGAPAPARPARVVLDQRNLQFSPHVLAVRVGTTVVFPNNDRVFHNVFSFHHGTVFDLGLYPVGSSKAVRFDSPGLSRIFCNIHPGMAAYIYAVESPYFAVSDETGSVTLPPAPPGRYTYRAWRAGAAERTGVWDTPASGASGRVVIEWPR